jgi:hypothetical protein
MTFIKDTKQVLFYTIISLSVYNKSWKKGNIMIDRKY